MDHIEDVAQRLAKEGYVSVAVDLFEEKTISNITEGIALRQKITEDKMMKDLDETFDFLSRLDYVYSMRIGCLGFCMGGGLSLLFACRNKELAAAAAFYGRPPSPIGLVKNISCPVLWNYAGQDYGITERDLNLFKDTLSKYRKVFDIKVYPGVPHAFFNDTRKSYRPDAAKDAWERTLNFFEKFLKT